MQIKKMVWFDKPGEKEKLNELAEKYKNESSLATAIESNFKVSFTEAMQIASIWMHNVTNAKKQ